MMNREFKSLYTISVGRGDDIGNGYAAVLEEEIYLSGCTYPGAVVMSHFSKAEIRQRYFTKVPLFESILRKQVKESSTKAPNVSSLLHKFHSNRIGNDTRESYERAIECKIKGYRKGMRVHKDSSTVGFTHCWSNAITFENLLKEIKVAYAKEGCDETV
ncbi:MAG: hypothetical protein GY810_32330 [Aureispira sp.]|nr:hypothetical protein [Aureispira sp.]